MFYELISSYLCRLSLSPSWMKGSRIHQLINLANCHGHLLSKSTPNNLDTYEYPMHKIDII